MQNEISKKISKLEKYKPENEDKIKDKSEVLINAKKFVDGTKKIFKAFKDGTFLLSKKALHKIADKITSLGKSKHKQKDRKLAFEDNSPFSSCITKINNTLIDNAENLNIVMLMYNFLDYSKNYRETTEIL